MGPPHQRVQQKMYQTTVGTSCSTPRSANLERIEFACSWDSILEGQDSASQVLTRVDYPIQTQSLLLVCLYRSLWGAPELFVQVKWRINGRESSTEKCDRWTNGSHINQAARAGGPAAVRVGSTIWWPNLAKQSSNVSVCRLLADLNIGKAPHIHTLAKLASLHLF